MTTPPASITFEGKELTLWTYSQLEGRTKEKLRNLALDLRSIVGADRVPSPPRPEEELRAWILQMQSAITGLSPADFGMRKTNAQNMPMSRAESEAPSEAGGATPYQEARRASELARDRNRGSGNPLGCDTGEEMPPSRGRRAQQQPQEAPWGQDLGAGGPGGYPGAADPWRGEDGPRRASRGSAQQAAMEVQRNRSQPQHNGPANRDNQAAYLEAQRGSQLAKARNRGSDIFG